LSRTPPGSFWPTPLQRALLQIALGPPDQAVERWQTLQPLEVTTLEPGSFALLPLLHERLKELLPDEPQLPRLAGTYRSIWYRNGLLLDRLGIVLRLLRERVPVEPLLVGGTSALLRAYPRLGLRPVPQIELVVEEEAAAAAVEVATYAGWRPTGRTRTFTRLIDQSRRVLIVHHGPPPAIVGPLGQQGLRALRGRAVELEDVAEKPLVLDPVDEVLFACATGARAVPVRTCAWLVDVHHLLGSAKAPPPEEMLERARRVHLTAQLSSTLGYLSELTDDASLSTYKRAFDEVAAPWRDRLAFRLAGMGGARLAGATQVVAGYLQATADDPTLRTVIGLPRYFQQRWAARSRIGVPLIALQKTLRLLLPRLHPLTWGRNRSASS
jgi:hypothetical protein